MVYRIFGVCYPVALTVRCRGAAEKDHRKEHLPRGRRGKAGVMVVVHGMPRCPQAATEIIPTTSPDAF